MKIKSTLSLAALVAAGSFLTPFLSQAQDAGASPASGGGGGGGGGARRMFGDPTLKPAERADAFIKRWDKDSDGKLDAKEVAAMIESMPQGGRRGAAGASPSAAPKE